MLVRNQLLILIAAPFAIEVAGGVGGERLERGGIAVVRIWNWSRAHYASHVGNATAHAAGTSIFDCTHYCTPGPVDAWMRLTLTAIATACPRR